ncbi:VWA domain-containing protein [Rhodobacter sp. NSM]|uniref:VWA domain-containing protein n=1 Tax=Rhodobacter sp. NSM TaxID=3457501 RepID=UPI003FD22D58
MSILLLRPLWLALLLPIALLALIVWRRRAAGTWERIVAPLLLERMRGMGYVAPADGRWLGMLPFLVAAVLVAGLAGPARLRQGALAYDRMDPIILILDMSPSVAATAQLADAQAAAALVLQTAGGRPVGLMLYASDAYVASAPTSDAASLESLVAVLGPETMPVEGSRPDIALSFARELFAADGAAGLAGADLIVISDGGGVNARAWEEARRLDEAGARVWALELSRGGLPEGMPPPAADALSGLAKAGGGDLAPAREPRPLLARMGAARARAIARSSQAPDVLDDFGRLLVLLALAPALLLFRRPATGER